MSFRDTKQREWRIEITIGTAMRLKADGINLYSLTDANCQGFFDLRTNDEQFAKLLWALVRPQAEAAGVSEADFYDGLDGLTTYAAWEEFAAAYLNFTRAPEIRSLMENGLRAVKKHEQQTLAKVQERLAKVEELFAAKLQAAMPDQEIAAILEAELAKANPRSLNGTSGA